MSYKTLFQFPLQMVIVGRSGSGKSSLLRNKIIPHIINDYDAAVVYSPSAQTDAGWVKMENKYNKIHLESNINEKDIANFIFEIGEKKKKGGQTKWLFIFDDITTFLSASNSSFFATLATRARHNDISYIITTHKYKALNPLLRNNALQQIFFKPRTTLELNSIVDEIATVDVPPQSIKNMLKVCTGSYKAFYVFGGGEEDTFFCILANGDIKYVFPIDDVIREFEEETGEKFTGQDYKILHSLLRKTEKNIMFV